jgi:hypothetical protein
MGATKLPAVHQPHFFVGEFSDGLMLARGHFIHAPNILQDGYKFEGDTTSVV